MAQADTARESSEQLHRYLTFMLAGEVFAMGILAVKEIIEYASLTEVPLMPAYVRGVINLRGSVVPVVDLSVRFGNSVVEATKRTCIVIVEVVDQRARHVVGVVVDAVNSVVDIPATDIEPPPVFGTRIRSDLIHGMGKVNGQFVILLDVGHVLATDDLQALGEATEAA